MRRAGQRVRITSQLIDIATGTHLWAERYDRDLTDIFAYIDDHRETFLDRLCDYLRRPSISARGEGIDGGSRPSWSR